MHTCCTALLHAVRTTAAVWALTGAVFLMAPAAPAPAGTVVCDATTISVSAADMKAEDLIKEIGTACGVRMVARGEVFDDEVFSLQFENMPLRDGLERVLRTLDIPNHMLRFAGTEADKRLVEIYLVGEKGGERELTGGEPPAEAPKPRARPKPPPRPRPTPKAAKPQPAAQAALTPAEQAALEQQEELEEELEEKYIDLLDEIIDEQFENEEEISAERLLETYRQALPEDMRNNIPAEVLEEIELLSDD